MELSIKKVFISSHKRLEEHFNPYQDNTDVIVQLSNNNTYTASFFSYKNIEIKVAENEANSEFLNGKYFWVKNLVLIENCTEDLITQVVQEMIDEGEFFDAFYRL